MQSTGDRRTSPRKIFFTHRTQAFPLTGEGGTRSVTDEGEKTSRLCTNIVVAIYCKPMLQ